MPRKPPPQVFLPPLTKAPPELVSGFLGLVAQVNRGFEELARRIDSPTQRTALTPPSVTGLSVQARQGGFLISWTPVDNTRADGYLIVVASDTGMTQRVARYLIPDVNANSYNTFVGGTSTARSFQIYSKNGSVFSNPSEIVTATSSVVAQGVSGLAQPADTTFNTTETTLASTTLISTARTMLLLASLTCRSTSTARKAITMRLKEDSTVVLARTLNASNSTEPRAEVSLHILRNSAAGSHVYALTGQNTADNVNIDANDIILTAVEIPFVAATESEAAAATPASYTENPPPPERYDIEIPRGTI